MTGLDWILLVINIILLIALVSLIRGNVAMSESVARLQGEVEENGSVIDSAVIVLNGLANRLREALLAEDSLEQVSALADELDANSNRLAVAVAANTLSENDSEEFDSSEVDEAGDEESNNGEDDPDIITAPADDTVSAVDVAIESSDAAEATEADAPVADEGDEDETPPVA